MYGFVFVRVCSVVYTEFKITVGPRPFPYQNTGMTNQTHFHSSIFVYQFLVEAHFNTLM